VLDDVVVDGLECVGQWDEEPLWEAFEKEVPDQVDVAGRGFDDRSPAVSSQLDFGHSPVSGCEVAMDETTSFHSAGVMRQTTPLPTDLSREGADLHALAGYTAQSVEDVVVGERQLTVCLELPVHLVPQPLLYPHVGEPGTQFIATQPNGLGTVLSALT